MARAFGALRLVEHHPARRHARPRALRPAHAHGSLVRHRRTQRGLRPHGAREGLERAQGRLQTRPEERADSRRHSPRPATRRAARGRDHHRKDFQLARHRTPPRRGGHQPPRLPSRAGLRPRHQRHIHLRQHANGHGLSLARPKDTCFLKCGMRNDELKAGVGF